MKRLILGLSLILLFIPLSLVSESYSWNFNTKKMVGLFWVRNYEVTKNGFTPKEEITTTKQRIKKQAEEWFSAMIYGYKFEFVPNSRLHNVNQELILISRGKINPEKINFKEIAKTEERTEFLCQYTTTKNDQKRRAFWQQSRVLSGLGRGKASLFIGLSARSQAVNNATKNAIISLFKKKLANKPRMIKGNLIFVEPPRIYLKSGNLFAEVKILIEESEVENYLPPQ